MSVEFDLAIKHFYNKCDFEEKKRIQSLLESTDFKRTLSEIRDAASLYNGYEDHLSSLELAGAELIKKLKERIKNESGRAL